MSQPDNSAHATPQKLIYMANQIGKFFTPQDTATASAKIAEHITRFWDPRMRTAIIAYLDAGGAGLDPAGRQAIAALRGLAGS